MPGEEGIKMSERKMAISPAWRRADLLMCKTADVFAHHRVTLRPLRPQGREFIHMPSLIISHCVFCIAEVSPTSQQELLLLAKGLGAKETKRVLFCDKCYYIFFFLANAFWI